MTFRREGGACLSSTVRKKSQNWFAFSTDENSETLECSARNFICLARSQVSSSVAFFTWTIFFLAGQNSFLHPILHCYTDVSVSFAIFNVCSQWHMAFCVHLLKSVDSVYNKRL